MRSKKTLKRRQTKCVYGGKKKNTQEITRQLGSKLDYIVQSGDIAEIRNIIKQLNRNNGATLADITERSYLHIICGSRKPSLEIANLLIDNGADVNRIFGIHGSPLRTPIELLFYNLHTHLYHHVMYKNNPDGANSRYEEMCNRIMDTIPLIKLFINRGAIVSEKSLDDLIQIIHMCERSLSYELTYRFSIPMINEKNKRTMRGVIRLLKELNRFINYKPRSNLLMLSHALRSELDQTVQPGEETTDTHAQYITAMDRELSSYIGKDT